MAVHRFHPDPAKGDDPNAILWDGCEECEWKAANLTGLDVNNSRRVVELMLAVERGQGGHYRSVAERDFCTQLSRAYLVLEKAGYIAEWANDRG